MFNLDKENEVEIVAVPYVIRDGDTLYTIAILYNTSVEKILQNNEGIDPNNLIVGQQIYVPTYIQKYPSCSTTNYFVVTKKDTLESIAKYFNVAVIQLLYSNYGISKNLYEGQVLCIPVVKTLVNIEINKEKKSLSVSYQNSVIRVYDFSCETPEDLIPKGEFKVLNKQLDQGELFGAKWVGLSEEGVGIHGVDRGDFIDNISSEKSIILSDIDMSEFFNLVPVSTEVKIL